FSLKMLDPNNLSTSEVSKQPTFKFLVVDSGPLIKGVDVRHLAEKVYTIPEVILEIRDKHSREFLTQISFDIETILPNGEALKEVVNFSKKTGDYTSLSAIDLRVMALTYMLEVQVNGTKRLRKEPVKSLTQFGGNNKNLKKAEIDTPEQILSVKTKKDESVDIKVACMTTDYSMQNVLLQMGLNLVSVEGARIKKVKSWVLRITTNMEKQFCPSCGGATLIRTSTSTDMNGKVTYYLKKNFQYNLRGTKVTTTFGRNANNLILREDQKEYQKALKSHRKQKEVDIFDPDYVPKLFIGSGSSTSCGAPVIGYGRRNPNETTRGKGKGKKRR
ncbi:5707_t:CDS:2, partial [Gigaspora margarita]